MCTILHSGCSWGLRMPEIKNFWDKDTGIALEKISTLQFN